MEKSKLYIRGLRDGFPIFLGYIAVSFTFGIAAKKIGLTTFQAVLMSATNFTSAGQFAALSVISASASYLELALTQLVINLRYCLMSSSLTQRFAKDMPFFHRFLISFGNTDEVFGVCASYPQKLQSVYCYGVLTTALPGWVLGTLLGCLSGTLLPESVLSALGVALYAMFIALVIPTAKRNKTVGLIVIISMALSCVFAFAPVLKSISSGFRVIILTVLIAGAAAFLFPVEEDENAG